MYNVADGVFHCKSDDGTICSCPMDGVNDDNQQWIRSLIAVAIDFS